MVSFVLKNTLSDNGGVTRGLCKVDGQGMLTGITETHNIEKDGNQAVIREADKVKTLNADTPVSMNMWGLTPIFFEVLESGFERFLEDTSPEDLKAEYLLPTIIGDLLMKGKVSVKVLRSEDQWFGVTYREDREAVMNAIRKLVENGVYPASLYE